MARSTKDSSECRKLALIIGNGDYHRSENKINSCKKNAQQLTSLLQTIDFEVKTIFNRNKHDMNTDIIDFSKKICDGDLSLVYLLGHACQVHDTNYFMPVDDIRIETTRDVTDFGIDIEPLLARLVKRNPSHVTVLILDCCRPYFMKGASAATCNGLHEMNAPSRAFIQFSCAANQTTADDLFIKHFLKNIAQENVDISDIFNRIANDVYRESNSRQRPLSISGIHKKEQVYLNPAKKLPLDEIRQTEMKPFLKKQQELRAHYYNFPDIEEITNRNKPSIQQAEKFTKSILSQVPSGEVSERNTACHVLHNLLGSENSECLFFDSEQGMDLHDASGNLNDLSSRERPFVLKLNNSDGLANQKYKNDGDEKLRLVKTLDRMIGQNASHPILEDVRERLSKAHQTKKENICLQSVFDGSFNVVYLVLDGTHSNLKTLSELPKRLKANFEQYETAKMHPLLCRPAFDVAMFDEKGNKTFPNIRQTHEVGPPGNTKTYISPAGWTRYGLKVLGRYSSGDKWLEPFGDQENWYRAFHGTGRASSDDFKKSQQSFDQQYASVDAMASIHKTGFRKARVAAYGAGVYCSPDPTFPENGYVGEIEMDTQQGKKRYRCMMQVAVNPDGVEFTSDKDIWVVSEPEDIRPYGILIKEV